MTIPFRLIATVALPVLVDGARVLSRLRDADTPTASTNGAGQPAPSSTAEKAPADPTEVSGTTSHDQDRPADEDADRPADRVRVVIKVVVTKARDLARKAWARHRHLMATDSQYRREVQAWLLRRVTALIPNPLLREAVGIGVRFWVAPASAPA